MSLVELTRFLITSIVKDSTNILVEELNSDEKTLEILVKVKNEDMGKVIGKNGKTINAIRTLVQEASFLQENKLIKIEVEKL